MEVNGLMKSFFNIIEQLVTNKKVPSDTAIPKGTAVQLRDTVNTRTMKIVSYTHTEIKSTER